jgi:hypothetical protein
VGRGERGRVGGGGGSYRHPGSPRHAGPREEVRVRGRHGGGCGSVRAHGWLEQGEGDDRRAPPGSETRGKNEGGSAGRLGERWAAQLKKASWAAGETALGCRE